MTSSWLLSNIRWYSMTYENDVLVIPEKYKNMSIPELENEK